MTGITHDKAASFIEEKLNMTLQPRKLFSESEYFYDPKDPYHCLNLAVKRSLDSLPDELTSFISDIHHYYMYPQRKNTLKRHQADNGLDVLGLVHHAPTRWLSLSQSLTRLIEIWEAIRIYMISNHEYRQ